MRVKLKECKLGDALEFKRGYDLPRRSRVDGIVPIISSSGVSGFHNEAKAKAPGVVTGRYGTLGEVFYVDEDYWPLNTALYVKDFKGNYPRYIKYFLEQLDIAELNAAGAVPGVNRNHLHMLDVRIIEDYEAQKHVSNILENYDNLIENNNRRIQILETIAQKLYQEWFIHYRFPGHEQAEWQEAEQGKIPVGWEMKKLKDVCNLTMGQSPKSEFYNESGEGVPFFQGVRDFGQLFPTASVWCTKPTRFAKKDDILFSVRAPVGRLNIAGFDLSIGRGLCAINHKESQQAFLYQQIKSIFTKEDMMGGGTIFNSVTKSDMENIQLICPPNSLVREMNTMLQPIFKSLGNLSLKNENLKQQRDLLLPKLISK